MAPPPEVRAEIFGTPAARAKRIPGVSVLTPARGKVDKGPSRDADRGVGWDSDSDDEDGMPLGMSPPKTMQFYIPQSRLLKTPGMFQFLYFSWGKGWECVAVSSWLTGSGMSSARSEQAYCRGVADDCGGGCDRGDWGGG